MIDDAQTTPSSSSPADSQLVNSARGWMHDALDAWAVENFAKVVALAPLAVEHLGKAVLWRTNPVLLVPLTQSSEKSLVSLATKADLSDPALRTISLDILLKRLVLVLGKLPVEDKYLLRLIHVRNGAMHVGAPFNSQSVLIDSLNLCSVFLTRLGESNHDFFGSHAASVESLLDQQRSELEHKLLAKRARAQQRLQQLKTTVGRNFNDVVSILEKDALAARESSTLGAPLEGVAHKCPECGNVGLLLGSVEVESEQEWDLEETKDGPISYIVENHWKITHSPQAFACNVCHLNLTRPQELRALNVRWHGSEIGLLDLRETFDPGMHEFIALLNTEFQDSDEF